MNYTAKHNGVRVPLDAGLCGENWLGGFVKAKCHEPPVVGAWKTTLPIIPVVLFLLNCPLGNRSLFDWQRNLGFIWWSSSRQNSLTHTYAHIHTVTQIFRSRPVVYILNYLCSPLCMTWPEQCLCKALHSNVWATADSFTNSSGPDVLSLSSLSINLHVK